MALHSDEAPYHKICQTFVKSREPSVLTLGSLCLIVYMQCKAIKITLLIIYIA